jgi:hypothetical protein
LTKITLLKWTDILGLRFYTSILSSALQTKAHREKGDPTDTRWVFNFKKYFKNADEIELIVETVASFFECADILAIPPSRVENQPNSLQRLFGEKIRRVRDVETRKYHHKAPLSADYVDSYTIEKDVIKGTRLLVVDDICTTGTTLNHFAMRLESEGLNVVKFALGLDYKLDIIVAETIFVYERKNKQISDLWDALPDLDSEMAPLDWKT